MRAGQLNARVYIQQLGSTQDAVGQVVQSWTTLSTVWSNIKHNSGLESIRAGAEMSVVKASVRIRYNPAVTTAMRVVYGTTKYQIHAVLHDIGRKEYTDLVCEVI
jgi:SPP1 family predicted phage head-tail adaptor